jgi:signal transduction histidine kinase
MGETLGPRPPGSIAAGTSDALFRLVIEALPVGVVVMDASGDVLHLNQAATTIWGQVIPAGELRWQLSRGRWRSSGEPVLPQDWASVRALTDGVPQLDQVIDIEAFDGTQRTLRNSAVPIRGASGIEGAVVLIEDITDRVRLEGELAHAQKLEALGRLAGGVAHDFNNLLMVIFSYSESLSAAMDPADPRRDDVEEIRRAADSASGLTSQLLAFGRRDVQRPRTVVLEDAVADTHKLIARVIGDHITVTTELADPVNRVWIDPVQLEQVLVNLAINARDAMAAGGTLTIATATVDRGSQGERVARLAVSDTGVGMDGATSMKIFEPFFTTKARGQGTGLGLAAVHGIIERAGGKIAVRSTPGVGTTFEIELPLSLVPAVGTTPPPMVSGTSEQADPSTTVVLLVEDNDPVRAGVRTMLARLGYQVTDVADATAALAHLGAGGRVDLLITDVVLRGENGRELAEAAVARCPDLRVLFMSGYVDDDTLQHGRTTSGILGKPFTIDALALAVGKALGR